MKDLKLCLTFDFWLPWAVGFGSGWGFDWFQLGPLMLWWWGDLPTPLYDISVILYRIVSKYFGIIIACRVDSVYYKITRQSAWRCSEPQKGKSPGITQRYYKPNKKRYMVRFGR